MDLEMTYIQVFSSLTSYPLSRFPQGGKAKNGTPCQGKKLRAMVPPLWGRVGEGVRTFAIISLFPNN
jgi:hypothetical protein